MMPRDRLLSPSARPFRSFAYKSLVTQSSVGRAGTAAKSASRSKRQSEDIVRAEDALKRLVDEKRSSMPKWKKL